MIKARRPPRNREPANKQRFLFEDMNKARLERGAVRVKDAHNAGFGARRAC